MKGLMLHCGAEEVARAELAKVPTPEGTDTWTPVGHEYVVNNVQQSLEALNFEVIKQGHGLTRDGGNYFGVLELSQNNGDFGTMVGIRNSHLKQYPVSVVAGSHVFVCDNMAFSGEIRVSRRHTKYILDDLERYIHEAVTRLTEFFTKQRDQFEAYRGHELVGDRVNTLLIEMIKRKIIPNQNLPAVIDAWEKPPHEEFEPRTLWSLFNSVTEVGKVWSPENLEKRTRLLHGLCDAEVGIAV